MSERNQSNQRSHRNQVMSRLNPVTQDLLIRLYKDANTYVNEPNPEYDLLERACISYDFALSNWNLAHGVLVTLEAFTGKNYTSYPKETPAIVAARYALEDVISEIETTI